MADTVSIVGVVFKAIQPGEAPGGRGQAAALPL
jgi:hypothetical protein